MTLENPRYELFAQALASGITPSAAYVRAGFKADSGSASRLNSNASIRQRVAALLSAMAARSVKEANYTREWVVNQLIENAELAKAKGDFSASNAALKLLGNERHMFIERKESGQPGDFATLATPEEVMAFVAKELGADAAAALSLAIGKREAATPALDNALGDGDTIN